MDLSSICRHQIIKTDLDGRESAIAPSGFAKYVTRLNY